MKRWKVEFRFEPRDLWIGLYWDIKGIPAPFRVHLYFCFMPTMVIHLYQECDS